jgi:LmbE family N-acetylglucosaminyl deacetylase
MRLMVIAPHADDAEIGAGGYIAKRSDQGWDVFVVVATIGEIWNLHLKRKVSKEERIEELEASLDVLGTAEYSILKPDYDSRLHLVPAGELVGELDRCIDDFKPVEVLIPLPSSHQDHETMYRICVAACRPNPSKHTPMLIAAYEYPASGWGAANGSEHGGMYVDITGDMDRKMASLSCYKSQLFRTENDCISVHGAEALARLRGIEAGFKYAEKFTILRMRVG